MKCIKTLVLILINIITSINCFSLSIPNQIISWADEYNYYISELYSDDYSIRRRFGDCIVPNELKPCRALRLFEEVPQNAPVLSVGTERGFIDAAATKASHLLMIDESEGTCVYNTINTILLKASKNIKNYRKLRLEASLEEWIDQFSEVDVEFEAENRYEAIQSLWNYWFLRVRIPEFDVFHKESDKEFVNVNYLYNEEFFSHLKWLADNDRILIFFQDIAAIRKDSSLIQCLDQIDTKLGLIDVSNIMSIEAYCYNVHLPKGGCWAQHDTALMAILALEPYLDNSTIMLSTGGNGVLEGCREYLLNNLGVIKSMEIADKTACINEDGINQKDVSWDDDWRYSWPYTIIRARGLLPTNIVNFETLPNFIKNYKNKMCSTDEEEEKRLHPYGPSSPLDYSTDPFLFKNWGPKCMIEAIKWPILYSSKSEDANCLPKS